MVSLVCSSSGCSKPCRVSGDKSSPVEDLVVTLQEKVWTAGFVRRRPGLENPNKAIVILANRSHWGQYNFWKGFWKLGMTGELWTIWPENGNY